LLVYINALPATINPQSKTISLLMITNIIIAHLELVYFQSILNDVLANLKRWFIANKLALNFDKANYMKFQLNSGFDNKLLEVEANKIFILQTHSN
jgi:hypothetical protein